VVFDRKLYLFGTFRMSILKNEWKTGKFHANLVFDLPNRLSYLVGCNPKTNNGMDT